MVSATDNPFRPGFGKPPPLLAGRDSLVSELEGLLDRVTRKREGDCVVLYGPRGVGKTVLAEMVGELAKMKGAEVRELDAESFQGGVGGIVADLMMEEEIEEKYVEQAELGVPGTVKGIMSVSTLALHRIRSALLGLAGKSPAFLLIDEAHTMPPDSGRALLSAIQTCIKRRLPLLALLAGTPGLPAHLHKMRATYWERALKLPVGRLASDDETRLALSVPASQSGLPFDEDALELLVKESQRYPFFVQMVGSGAWGMAIARGGDPRRITLADAQAGVRKADKQRMEFYGQRKEEIVSQEVLYAAEQVSKAFVEQGDGILSSQKLEGVLVAAQERCVHPPVTVRNMLRELGLIWETEAGKWEPGIPSLCSFLVDNIGIDTFGRDRY